MMHYNDQYRMHKRAYHQVHHPHDIPFSYATTDHHDPPPDVFKSSPNMVTISHYNHHQIPQDVLLSPSSRNGGVPSVTGSSLPSSKILPQPSVKSSSSQKVTDLPQRNHVPFEQRLLLSDHNEYSSALHEHHRNRYHHKPKSKHGIVSDSSSTWYNEPVEFYPLAKHKTPHHGNKYHLLMMNNGGNFVRRVQSFHQNPQNAHLSQRPIRQPLFADQSQLGTHFNIHQYLPHIHQREGMRGIKLRQPVERHYSTLGHRKRPVVHQVYPSAKNNNIGIMIRGGTQNCIHKSQSLRRNSPYNVRRFPASMAYPVSELLQHKQLVTINTPQWKNNTSSIQRERVETYEQDRELTQAEEAGSHSMPSSFARRFNSSIRVHKKKTNKHVAEGNNDMRIFDDVPTITRLNKQEMKENDNEEIHTVSLESRQNSLPNPRTQNEYMKNRKKLYPRYNVKINNYVGSLDRNRNVDSKRTERQGRAGTNSSNLERLDYGKTEFLRNMNEGSISALSEQPFNILSSTLTNIEEIPLNGANLHRKRSNKRNNHTPKISSSFSDSATNIPIKSTHLDTLVPQMYCQASSRQTGKFRKYIIRRDIQYNRLTKMSNYSLVSFSYLRIYCRSC